MADTIYLQDLESECIIGIFKWERRKKQKVRVSLEMPCQATRAAKKDHIQDTLNYKRVAKFTLDFVQKSRFRLIESLAQGIADQILKEFRIPWVRISVSKPGAVRYSKDVGVSMTRHAHEAFPNSFHRVYVSIGSNIRRQSMMPKALKLLGKSFEITKQSSVYETSPVGMKSGQPFWNAVVELVTPLKITEVKKALTQIESELGRKKSQKKFASRPIDLDILFYDKNKIKQNGFQIPHKDSYDAQYVLLPLAEIAPNFRHPDLGQTPIEILGRQLDERGLFKKISF